MSERVDSLSSLARGLLVLEVVSSEQPIGVGELSRLINLPKSSVQRLLTTLAESGWLEATDERQTRWSLSTKLRTIGRRAGGDPGLLEAARPHLLWLRDKTQETVHLGIPVEDRFMLVLDRVDSTQAVRTFMALGTAMPLHTSASGKAAMSAWDEDRLATYLNRGLDRLTPSTLTSESELRDQLREARERGYACNFAENRDDVFAVGSVGTTHREGTPAVSVSMPASRFDRNRVAEWGALAREACERIDASLG